MFTLKMEIFPEIGPRKNFLVPPKFGARSPPMFFHQSSFNLSNFVHQCRGAIVRGPGVIGRGLLACSPIRHYTYPKTLKRHLKARLREPAYSPTDSLIH